MFGTKPSSEPIRCVKASLDRKRYYIVNSVILTSVDFLVQWIDTPAGSTLYMKNMRMFRAYVSLDHRFVVGLVDQRILCIQILI